MNNDDYPVYIDFMSCLLIFLTVAFSFGIGYATGYNQCLKEHQTILENSLKSDRPKADNKDVEWDVPIQNKFYDKELLV